MLLTHKNPTLHKMSYLVNFAPSPTIIRKYPTLTYKPYKSSPLLWCEQEMPAHLVGKPVKIELLALAASCETITEQPAGKPRKERWRVLKTHLCIPRVIEIEGDYSGLGSSTIVTTDRATSFGVDPAVSLSFDKAVVGDPPTSIGQISYVPDYAHTARSTSGTKYARTTTTGMSPCSSGHHTVASMVCPTKLAFAWDDSYARIAFETSIDLVPWQGEYYDTLQASFRVSLI